MNANGLWEPVTKPIAFWNQQLDTNFKDFFIALGKAAINVHTLQFDKAAESFVDVLGALDVERNAGQLAWILMRRGLAKATFNLVKENAQQLRKEPRNPNAFYTALDNSLEQVEITIDVNFFAHPASSPVFNAYVPYFSQWLIDHGLDENDARIVVDKLPGEYIFALSAEWRKRSDRYELITQKMYTPFTEAGVREQGWNNYSDWLHQQVNTPVFNEPFTLQQLYIELRAYYKQDIEQQHGSHQIEEPKHKRVVVDLKTQIDEWIQQARHNDAYRVISGGPGSGKSSFSKLYAAHQSRNPELRVVYIPLYVLSDPTGDIEISIRTYLTKSKLLTENPFDFEPSRRLLLIFDGLDELAADGKVGTQIVQDFVNRVVNTVGQYNAGLTARILVLMTGRDVAVESIVRRLESKGQHALYLLPYFVPIHEHPLYDDPDNRLKLDQRNLWWQQFGQLRGETYQKMPDRLVRRDLDDVTTQPLLNFLIALSYIKGRIQPSTSIDLNQIYRSLLDDVFERGYEGRKHRSLGSTIKISGFVRVLEEIGLATWHSGSRKTTDTEVQRRCESAGLIKDLDIFEDGAKEGVARLFTAFYIRPSEQGPNSYEFTHKSFGEYLTALRIVDALNDMHEGINLANRFRWNESQALQSWGDVYDKAPRLTEDIFRFVRTEIAGYPYETVSNWQKMLAHLISWMLRYGMPMEEVKAHSTYHEQNTAAIRAEEALLALLSACALATTDNSTVEWPDRTTAGTWLSRLQEQRTDYTPNLTLRSLSWLNLKGCFLIGQFLGGANLSGADLRHASLMSADLGRAQLIEADLSKADLNGAFLKGTDLSGTDMINTNLSESNLSRAYLSKAYLVNAILRDANLSGAQLIEADLSGADLSGANLREAYLNGANLSRTTLPDGTKWTPETDMARFTNPDHPRFWRPR